jgi:hypothetical protein
VFVTVAENVFGVTVMSSNVDALPRLVVPAPAAATRPGAPFVVIEIVPV